MKNFFLISFFVFSILNSFTSFSQVEIKISEKIETENGQRFYLHTVEKGQTLFSISKIYKVPIAEINADNPFLSSGLKLGQTIKIKCNEISIEATESVAPTTPPKTQTVSEKISKNEEVKPVTSAITSSPTPSPSATEPSSELNINAAKFSKKYFDDLELALQNPDSVGYLDLSMNNLGTFPAKIIGMMNLKFLDLSYNNLAFLPMEISKMEGLQFLDLTGNKLTFIPDFIGKLANLKQIILKETNLSSSEIQKLKRLLPNCKVIVS